ncbi:MAG TPA: hypothetical protein EYN66_20505 [Myxococcales bacterium]|nr:hypothetical protein [Myxococcales bacterium]
MFGVDGILTRTIRHAVLFLIAAGLSISACGEAQVLDWNAGANGDSGDLAKADSSIDAIFLNFEFSGNLIVDSSWAPNKQIENQLLFTIGQLNGENSVGRLDKVVLTQVELNETDDGTVISYHAKMPVAWGQRNNVPTSYTLILPIDLRPAAQDRFAQRYGHSCVDRKAHDVDAGSMWYYFRPHRSGCNLEAGSVNYEEATVRVSPINTTGRYPEYHKVWEDNRLEVVAIFGKFEEGATSNWDAGISSYNKFINTVKDEFRHNDVHVTPDNMFISPGVDNPDVTIEATLPDGRQVRVVVLLVDGVQNPGTNFDARYEELSTSADLIAYNGHSGLGANIQTLAQKGEWVQGQYAIVFMNGCDTYAYVDSELADAHTAVNPDDPNGTKYLDIVTNAMPSPANKSSQNTMALTQGLLSYENPMTYEEIFANFHRSQVVLVSGEQDNTFTPNGQ